MAEVEILGKKFPLCLTVAAVDKINEKCGGLNGITKFLDGAEDGKVNTGKAMCNTAWLLGLLIQEGEENRLILARFSGEKAERRVVPDSEAICHLLTIASAKKYRTAVFEAVNESLKQEIEAVYQKNVESEEQA